MRRLIGLLIGTLLMLAIALGAPTIAQTVNFGDRSFTEYEAYLNPAQELGPASGSTAKGYGQLRFPKNLTRGDVQVQIADVDSANVTAFHIHCGTPDVLGPIVVNFNQFGDFKNTIKNGRFSASVTNDKLTFVKQPPPPPNLAAGFKLPLPEGCPSDIIIPAQINTIAGMEALARKGVLYFNLHTKGHEFYGEMRGQIYPVQKA